MVTSVTLYSHACILIAMMKQMVDNSNNLSLLIEQMGMVMPLSERALTDVKFCHQISNTPSHNSKICCFKNMGKLSNQLWLWAGLLFLHSFTTSIFK